ncbi:MAG TPA: hypothetical protein VD772_10655 [Anseongella sp.]|nr:hypothetical protein [Anseongella sp.]
MEAGSANFPRDPHGALRAPYSDVFNGPFRRLNDRNCIIDNLKGKAKLLRHLIKDLFHRIFTALDRQFPGYIHFAGIVNEIETCLSLDDGKYILNCFAIQVCGYDLAHLGAGIVPEQKAEAQKLEGKADQNIPRAHDKEP